MHTKHAENLNELPLHAPYSTQHRDDKLGESLLLIVQVLLLHTQVGNDKEIKKEQHSKTYITN